MKKGWKGFVLEVWSCIYGNNQCVFLFKVFVKIISARMFSIPHIAGGGRLCLERHWPRDRRRHDSWRRLQTFKAKPPGNMEVLVDWLENLMYLLEAETKQLWKIYICWITQNDTKYDKAYQYAGCMELFFCQGEFNKIFLQSYGRLPAEAANEEEGQTGLCLRWCGLWPLLFWSKNAMLFFVKCSMQWLLQAFGAPTKREFRWKRIRVVFPATVADQNIQSHMLTAARLFFFFWGIGWCEYISGNTFFHGFLMAQEMRMQSHPSPLPLDLHEAVISKGF